MILTKKELIEITGKKQHSKQAQTLRHMNIPFKTRLDGSLVVASFHFQKDDFISKPFGPEDLRKLISNYIVTASDRLKTSELEKDKLGVISSEENIIASENSIDLSRFVKMANNKPEFLRKFINNTLTAFQDYLEDFQKAADLRDANQISELIHKSTMSVYYIQSDKLVKLLRDCQSCFEDKNASSEEIEAVIKNATAEFHQVIISLKNIDVKSLMN